MNSVYLSVRINTFVFENWIQTLIHNSWLDVYNHENSTEEDLPKPNSRNTNDMNPTFSTSYTTSQLRYTCTCINELTEPSVNDST